MIDILVRVVSALLMIGMPIGLFFYLRKKIDAKWRFIAFGAGTFVAAQAFHIPFNMLVLPALLDVHGLDSILEASGADLCILALFLGLSAGVFEEVFRYLVYRYWLLDDERTWKNAIALGAGHGGCEAIIVGVLALVALIQMVVLRHEDLSKILPEDKVSEAQEQIAHYWSLAWYEVLMQPVERVTAMTFHVSASVFMLQVFLRKNYMWLVAAITLHTAIDAFVVIALVQKWNILVIEAVLGAVVLPLSLGVIFHFRPEDSGNEGANFQAIPQQDGVELHQSDSDDPSLISEDDVYHEVL